MPAITYDGRSFMVDGRRIWLVSGSIHYARVPEDEWVDRIHAARLAGLNTIDTPVFWSVHEPLPGQFDWTGPRDIRRFVDLVSAAGLYSILRPGPYVGEDWDFGALPAWLHEVPGVGLRTASWPFLEACSRYLTALAGQLRDRQVTSPGKGGPIILVQNESAWTCGLDSLAHSYLGEISRYLRESGFTVPIINSNNLWQSVEREIDCWRGRDGLLGVTRQLGAVRRDHPRLVIDFDSARPAVWGEPAPTPPDPFRMQRRLAEVLAGGGQFNIHPFHGGTNFGYAGGRRGDGHAAFVAATYDLGAPLGEAGAMSPAYQPVRRLCSFASRFARVFANLDPAEQSPVADPAPAGPRDPPSATVVSVHGTQGGVAFVFVDRPPGPKGRSVSIILADGSALHVPMSQQSVAWVLLDVHLGGRARLDYCTLCALGQVGATFLCYGPAGSTGVVSINGSALDVSVPRGESHVLIEHEGVHVVALSEESVETAFLTEREVFLGASSLRSDGTPIAAEGAKWIVRVDGEGRVSRLPAGPLAVPRGSAAHIEPANWLRAGCEEFIAGTSDRFAAIAGPTPLAHAGSYSGYGWYRVRFRLGASRRVRAAFPEAGDHLLVALDGNLAGTVGGSPGAPDEVPLSLGKGHHTLVVLAENMGRFSAGAGLGERKGLYGQVQEVKAVRAGRPKIEHGPPIDVLRFRVPLWEVHPGDVTVPERLTWSIIHRRRTPLLLRMRRFVGRGLVVLNGEPVRFVDAGGPAHVLLMPEQLSRGRNIIQFALLAGQRTTAGERVTAESAAGAFAAGASLLECAGSFSDGAEWGFAKWAVPPGAEFVPAPRVPAPGPAWWRASFETPAGDVATFIDLTGMTRGQVFVNGRHLARYVVSTGSRRATGPQTRFFVPRGWMREEGINELLLFDSGGATPARVRVHGDPALSPLRS